MGTNKGTKDKDSEDFYVKNLPLVWINFCREFIIAIKTMYVSVISSRLYLSIYLLLLLLLLLLKNM